MKLSPTYIAAILLTISALHLSCGCESIIDETLPSYEETSLVGIGDEAPSFYIESLDGDLLSIPNGEATLLILFSHTCPDCKAMMSDLQEYINQSGDTPNIVAISRGGTAAEIEAFRQENNLTYPIAADEAKTIYYTYAKMYVPRCYIIDKEGIIRHTTYEYKRGDIEQLIAAYNTIM